MNTDLELNAPNTTSNIWVRLDENDYDALQHIVKNLPGSRAAHGRQAIKEYLERMIPKISDPWIRKETR